MTLHKRHMQVIHGICLVRKLLTSSCLHRLKYVQYDMDASDCLSQACLPPDTATKIYFTLLYPLTGKPLHTLSLC